MNLNDLQFYRPVTSHRHNVACPKILSASSIKLAPPVFPLRWPQLGAQGRKLGAPWSLPLPHLYTDPSLPGGPIRSQALNAVLVLMTSIFTAPLTSRPVRSPPPICRHPPLLGEGNSIFWLLKLKPDTSLLHSLSPLLSILLSKFY